MKALYSNILSVMSSLNNGGDIPETSVSYLGNATISALKDRIEATKTGSRLNYPGMDLDIVTESTLPWINPLDFKQNLNTAISCLDQLDELNRAIIGLQQMEISNNYMSASLQDEALTKHSYLYNQLDMKSEKLDLTERIARKTSDLIHYTNASIFGATHMLKKSIPEHLKLDKSAIIKTTREVLRYLLEQLRIQSLKRQSSTFSVSIKFTKSNGARLTTNKWKAPGQEERVSQLNDDEFVIDLREFAPFSVHGRSFIDDIGVELITHNGTFRGIPLRTNDNNPGQIFELSLFDESPGVPLGEGVDLYKVPKLHFGGIGDGKIGQKLVWSGSDSIRGVPPNRAWKIKIDTAAAFHADISQIWDIILHFRVSLLEK